MTSDLVSRLREGEALCDKIGLKDARIYGEAAREIESWRRKAERLVRVAVESYMGKANERDVGIEARKLIESLIGDLYSVRVVTYPPGDDK